VASLSLPHADSGALIGGACPDALYVHVPFCRHKCHYCDFYSLVDTRNRQEAYVRRLQEEAAACGEATSASHLRSIFIGGGTPTMLTADEIALVLSAISSAFNVQREAGVEWTVEANPETVDPQRAQALAQGGVNRLSIGCQTFDTGLLETLERHHDPASVGRAVSLARDAGIDRVSLDLIYGIPGSTMEQWEDDLEEALALGPSHLSCYCLTFEPGTPLHEKRRLGRIDPLDEDIQVRMYHHTRRRLSEAGFQQYEISNWARPGEICRHNLAYWRNMDWLPLGPAAAGHIKGTRWRNLPRLDDWLSSGPFSPIVELEQPEPRRNSAERLMLGFRLLEGFSEQELEDVLAMHPPCLDARLGVICRALEDGVIERQQGRVRLTASGVLLADGFLSDLL